MISAIFTTLLSFTTCTVLENNEVSEKNEQELTKESDYLKEIHNEFTLKFNRLEQYFIEIDSKYMDQNNNCNPEFINFISNNAVLKVIYLIDDLEPFKEYNTFFNAINQSLHQQRTLQLFKFFIESFDILIKKIEKIIECSSILINGDGFNAVSYIKPMRRRRTSQSLHKSALLNGFIPQVELTLKNNIEELNKLMKTNEGLRILGRRYRQDYQ